MERYVGLEENQIGLGIRRPESLEEYHVVGLEIESKSR